MATSSSHPKDLDKEDDGSTEEAESSIVLSASCPHQLPDLCDIVPSDHQRDEDVESISEQTFRNMMREHLPDVTRETPSLIREVDLEDIHNDLDLSTSDVTSLDTKVLTLPYPYGYIVEKECDICLETEDIVRQRKCCSIPVCDQCMQTYFMSKVDNGLTRVQCIGDKCSEFVHVEEMMCRLPQTYKEKYYRRLVDANNNPYVKTCPRCSYIHSISPSDKKSPKKQVVLERGHLVICPDCQLEWCFSCHAPWHLGITCKDFQKGDKLVKSWAKEIHFGQKNASQCPKCKAYIEKNGGCNHMYCVGCNTNFCYRCGQRIRCLKFIGNHNEKLSPLGCKYNFLPERPVARKAIRGSVFGAKVMGGIVLGGLLVAAGAIFVAVSPIVIPAYIGHTYRRQRRAKSSRKYRRNLRIARNIDNILEIKSREDNHDIERDLEQALQKLRELQTSLEPSREHETNVTGLTDPEVMTASQSSSNSTATDDADQQREDEVLRVGVQGQKEGLENVEVWIHCQDQDKSLKKSEVKGHSVSSVDVGVEKEVLVSEQGNGCLTTAKLVSSSEEAEVVLHVVTKIQDEKKTLKDESNKAGKDTRGSNSNFVVDESNNGSDTNGCFVKLFGKKLPAVVREKDKDLVDTSPQSKEPKVVQENKVTDKTEGHPDNSEKQTETPADGHVQETEHHTDDSDPSDPNVHDAQCGVVAMDTYVTSL